MCPPLEEIKGLTANQLLKKYDQYNAMPVDIVHILTSIKANLVEDDLTFLLANPKIKEMEEERGELCGLVLATKDDLNIFFKKYNVSLTDSKTMQSYMNRTRFTLAHELAHCVLHAEHLERGYLEFRFDSKNIESIKEKTYEKLEYDANIYAGQLLIPEHTLREVLDKLFLPSLKALSELFEVSSNVMKARLEYLNITYLNDIR